MNKQQLAQKRNWFKYQLTGLHFNVQQNPQEILTTEEWCYLQNLIDYKNKLIEKFDENNKILGLKVKNENN